MFQLVSGKDYIEELKNPVLEDTEKGEDQKKALLGRNALPKADADTLKKKTHCSCGLERAEQKSKILKGEIEVMFGSFYRSLKDTHKLVHQTVRKHIDKMTKNL